MHAQVTMVLQEKKGPKITFRKSVTIIINIIIQSEKDVNRANS